MSQKIVNFQSKIWDFYEKNKRDFPWRTTTNPYNILISEMMLQQTQTSRVIEKYQAFIHELPDFDSLAKAPLPKVLSLWQGLGYNRRALFLKRTAEIIAKTKLELTVEFLQTLPGIGLNTAGAIYVFSTNKPSIFIETNIRRVFIHEFFSDTTDVSDKSLIPLISRTLPSDDFRNWYYALMDYGAYLGKGTTNPNRKSKHYKRQSKFEGSLRQARGKILSLLLNKPQDIKTLSLNFENQEQFTAALDQLVKEGFVKKDDEQITIQS